MIVENHTQYSTADLRKILAACCRADDFKVPKNARVRVVYARSSRISGWAAFGARNCHHDYSRRSLGEKVRITPCAMLLRIPRRDLDLQRFIGVCRHEVGHWRGLRHVQMGGSLLRSWDFDLADHPWAQGLTLGQKAAPKAPTMTERVSLREQHARKMLAEHEAKLKRESKLVAKWRQKVRYYEKKSTSAPEPQQIAASPAERTPQGA